MIRIQMFVRKEQRWRKLSYYLSFLHEWILFSIKIRKDIGD
jgi:hypothetical protein